MNGGGLNGRSRSRVRTGLLVSSSADCFCHAMDDGVEELDVSRARLPLAAAPDIAEPCDERKGDNDGEDRRETGAEACPMQVDEGESVVRLVQVHIGRFVADVVSD